jgi:hypothetical protein
MYDEERTNPALEVLRRFALPAWVGSDLLHFTD